MTHRTVSIRQPVPSTQHLRKAIFALVCILISSMALMGQNAGISGIVTDSKGGVIAGATVLITNTDQGSQRQVVSDTQGFFAVPILPPGRYQVTVRHEGFAAAEVKDLVLRVGDQPNLKITLQVRALVQTINVEAGAPLLQTESSTVGTIVDRHFVENMPLSGRSFQSLIELTAGVVYNSSTSSSVSGQFAVNGQRQDANTFWVDGVSANSGVSNVFGIGSAGTGNAPAASANGSFSALVSVENLQEFKIQTSGFAPEYGRSPGGQISMVTRSGTNRFTGSVFEYFRNTVLDASNWFNNANSLPKSPEEQNDFGGVFGGPIKKDKLFFFYSYEGLRLLQPTTGSFYVPSLTARQIQSGLQPILQAFVLPNGPVNPADSNTALFNGSWSNPTSLDNNSVRVDYIPFTKMTLFARYYASPSNVDSRGGANTASVVTRTYNSTKSLTVGDTVLFNPQLTNEVRLNATWSSGGQASHIDNFGGAVVPSDSYLFPSGHSAADSMISAPMLNGSTLREGLNVGNPTEQLNLVDDLSWVKGSHQMKFGVDYRRLHPTLLPRLYDMQVTLNKSANYTNGIADSVRLQAKAAQEYLFHNLSFYGQDAWKITPALTVTYGLRWDINPAPTSPNGHPGFVLTPIALPVGGISVEPLGASTAYPTSYTNFAPRLGIAYQMSKSPRFGRVIRGGFGNFYDTADSASAAWQGPYNAQRSMTLVPFPLVGASAVSPTLPAAPPYVISATPVSDLKAPYVYQANFTIEQALGSNQTLTLSYIGAFGHRLLRSETFQINSPVITSLTAVTNNAQSNYNSFQAQFQRRMSRGLQVLSSFTWAHSIDNASLPDSANGNSLQPGFINRDRGDSDFDVRLMSSTAISYDVPSFSKERFVNAIAGHWGADVIYRYSGATPFNVIGNTVLDPTTGTNYTSRPNLNLGVPLWLPGAYPGGRRLNPAAFSAAPAGKEGSLGRNVLRGFPVDQIDLALRRTFALTERFKLQFRSDFFNILNHPMFGNPPATLAQPATFGIANALLSNALSASTGFSPLYQVGSPRSIQLSLKLVF